MSLLSRIKRALWSSEDSEEAARPPAAAAEQPPVRPALPVGAPPPGLVLSEEQLLRDLVAAADASPQALPELDPAVVMQWVTAVRRGGHEPTAVDLLRRVARRFEAYPELRLDLARLLYDLGQEADALDLLEQLTEHRRLGHEAHMLLGEHLDREAEQRQALFHFEAVLADDFANSRARRRADQLRRRLALPAGVAAPTIMGAADLGPGSRFTLQRELGRGGGGTVYLARDRSLDRAVAVKVLHPHVAQQVGAREHLFCEARLATSLHHPQIITIYDLDEQLNLVVMEYCAGGALAQQVPLQPRAALERLAEIALVLETVHRSGVVHRDLKPSNFLLRRQGDPGGLLVLTDFGIAHATAGQHKHTALEAGGTLAYTAPEQRRGEDADPLCDLYSCGVLLVEMLLGRCPLSHQQAVQGLVLAQASELWRELTPLAGDAVVQLARQLVAPDPMQRPPGAATVAQLAGELAREAAQAEDREAVRQELAQGAGQGPRSPALEAWLADPWRG